MATRNIIETGASPGGMDAQSTGLDASVELAPPSIEKAAKPTPRKILVVDDNRDAADTLVLILRYQGHDVMVSYAGWEALEMLRRQSAEVVLLDISMPDMDGFETAGQIRNLPDGDKVLIIALTGYGQSHDKKRTRQSGFDGHLVKPVDLTELTELVSELFPRKIKEA